MRRIFSVTRRKRWLILLTSALILALCIVINRAQLMRAVIAYKIYHAQIFTPPPMSSESAWQRFTESAQFYWDFADFVMARNQRLKQFKPALKSLVKEIARRQASGEEMEYSMHIYREIRWLLNFTARDKETQAQIAELRDSLTLPPITAAPRYRTAVFRRKLGAGTNFLVSEALLFSGSSQKMSRESTVPVHVPGPN